MRYSPDYINIENGFAFDCQSDRLMNGRPV